MQLARVAVIRLDAVDVPEFDLHGPQHLSFLPKLEAGAAGLPPFAAGAGAALDGGRGDGAAAGFFAMGILQVD